MTPCWQKALLILNVEWSCKRAVPLSPMADPGVPVDAWEFLPESAGLRVGVHCPPIQTQHTLLPVPG